MDDETVLKFANANKFFERTKETEPQKNVDDSEFVVTDEFFELSHEYDHNKTGQGYHNG